MAECLNGLDECKFTSKIVYTIVDDNGNEVEETTYVNNIKMTYYDAVAMKYLHFDGNKGAFLRVRMKGSMQQALE